MIPLTLRIGNPLGGWPRTDPKVHSVKGRPMQSNTCDCDIFICKYVDYLLRGDLDLTKEKWSDDDVTVFRYRIAYELIKCKARDIAQEHIN